MMMLNANSQVGKYDITIETYDGQTRSLRFNDFKDVKTFFETDFEVVNVKVPEQDDPLEIKELLQEQDIMDVNRKAIINLEQEVDTRVESQAGEYVPRDTSRSDTRVYDFNLHEKDIHKI